MNNEQPMLCIYATNMAGQYLTSFLTYVTPVLRKIPFPYLPPTSGGKTGILRNMGAT